MNVSVVARTNQTQDAFWVGSDGSMYTSFWSRGWPWSGKKSLGGNFVPGSVVCPVTRAPNIMDLFAIDKKGSVLNAWWTEGKGWESVGDKYQTVGINFEPGAPMAAIARTPDRLNLFAMGRHGHIWTAHWGGGQPWSSLPGGGWRRISTEFLPNIPVSVVSRAPQNLDCSSPGPMGVSTPPGGWKVRTGWGSTTAGLPWVASSPRELMLP